jgi:hypothetical protein
LGDKLNGGTSFPGIEGREFGTLVFFDASSRLHGEQASDWLHTSWFVSMIWRAHPNYTPCIIPCTSYTLDLPRTSRAGSRPFPSTATCDCDPTPPLFALKKSENGVAGRFAGPICWNTQYSTGDPDDGRWYNYHIQVYKYTWQPLMLIGPWALGPGHSALGNGHCVFGTGY